MPSIKKRIRDIDRLLTRDHITDAAKVKLNVELQTLHSQHLKNKEHEKQRQFSIKYHKIKFFERKKVTRRIHRIDTEIKSFDMMMKDEDKVSNDEINADKRVNHDNLSQERHELVEDLVYIMYYPRDMKYVSLYKKKQDDIDGKEEDGVTAANRIRARAAALQAWEQDKQYGRDLVEHAIQVEYHQAGAPHHNNNNYYNDIDDGDYIRGYDDVDDNDNHHHPIISKKLSSKSKHDTSLSSSKKRKHDDVNDDDDDIPTIPTHISKKHNHINTPSSSSLSSSSIKKSSKTSDVIIAEDDDDKHNDMVDDPFFVEAVTVSSTLISDPRHNHSHKTSSIKPRRGMSGVRALEKVDTAGMSKQELRLLEWKKKRARQKLTSS